MAEEKDRVLGSAAAAVVAGAKEDGEEMAAGAERAAFEVVAAADRARERRRTAVVARPSMITACFRASFLNFLCARARRGVVTRLHVEKSVHWSGRPPVRVSSNRTEVLA